MSEERPTYCEERPLAALDRIRDMGVCNMFQATGPLQQCFPDLDEHRAGIILMYWIAEGHKREGAAS